MWKLIGFCSRRRVAMASSTPLRLCSRRACAWAAIPVVLRFQVFSLMGFLLLVLLTLLPFFVGVLAFLFISFCDNMPLSKESNSWPDPLIKVFLVHIDPVGISRLLTDLNPFQNLLLVGFERGQILWGKDIGRAMKTRQFHKFTHDFRGFQAGAKGHFHVLTMFSDALRIKPILACHGQQFLRWHKLWPAVVELDNALLHRLFPLDTHGLIENFGVDEGHFRRSMGHPLLDHDKGHPIVDEFYCLRMSERMEPEVENVSLIILDLIVSC